MRLLRSIFASERLTLGTELPAREALLRLASVSGHPPCCGYVRVAHPHSIHDDGPLFPATFVGRVIERDGHAALVGRFTTPLLLRGLTLLFAIAALIATARLTTIGLSHGFSAAALAFGALPLLVLALHFVLLARGSQARRHDQVHLKRALKSLLS